MDEHGTAAFTQPPSAFSERLELNFLQGMLMWIFSSIPDTYVSVAESYTRKQLLFHKFMHLIHEHAAQMHQVSFYAEKLCISPRYLHEITETYSNGKTPKALIDEQLTAELKVLLNNPALSIAEIASLCQFPDSSYLSRFFKKNTGISPKEYRTQNNLELYHPAGHFITNCCHHAFHLCQGKHTSVERVTGIVSFFFIAQHRTSMVYSHWQSGIFFLKNTD